MTANHVIHTNPFLRAYTMFASVKRYNGEFFTIFFLRIDGRWGIIKSELGELSLPALSALEDGVDNKNNVGDGGEYLNNYLDFFPIPFGLFLFLPHRVHLLSLILL